MRSYQGSRHPWTLARFDSSNNVIPPVLAGIVTDIYWSPGAPSFALHVTRGDNQSGGGNGGYQCYFEGP